MCLSPVGGIAPIKILLKNDRYYYNISYWYSKPPPKAKAIIKIRQKISLGKPTIGSVIIFWALTTKKTTNIVGITEYIVN